MNRLAHTALAAAAAALLTGGVLMSSASGSTPPPSPIGAADQPASTGKDAPSGASLVTPTNNPEDVYRPVQPCRIVDGRKALGVLASGHTRSYDVRGTTGFVPQGGTSGGCGIPTSASAVTFSISIVEPNRSGYLRAWPAGTSEPTATVMNYTATESETVTAPITLSSSDNPKDLTVKVVGADAQIVIDVQGYYAPQMYGNINLDGSISKASARVLSSTRTATGTFQITLDRDVTGCAATASPFGSGNFIASAVPSGNKVDIYAYRPNNSTAVDIRFTFEVSC